jgi:lipopolysaccharide transport system permease protein
MTTPATIAESSSDRPAPLPADPPAPHPRPDDHLLVIEAGREGAQYWADLWRGRELLGFMVWRDLLVRYKQTVVGIGWSVFRPLLTMLAGTFVFQFVLRTQGIEGVPYAVMVYLAVLPWQFFADCLSGISGSLVGNAGILTKIYFPRLMIPISRLAVCLVDFLLSCIVLALIMTWYHFAPSPRIVLLPLFVLMACATALGAGLWFAALNVRYRDVMFLVPFILQFGAYVSPVFFPTERIYASTLLPAWAKFAYALNPLVGVIDGFRWCVLGGAATVHWDALAGSVVLLLIILFTGLRYFRKTETTFADII